MASDQWNGFHHAPHPDEDDDWYYDEPEYLADQNPPPPPQQSQQSAMLHYQPYVQPAQPKIRVDLSQVSYSTWQNPWQSSLRYQNQSARPAYGYSAWDYQEEEGQDEEYASSGMEDVDSSHANPHFLDQDEPEPGPPPAPPTPAPPTHDVVVPPVAPIIITTGQLPPGIPVPSSPSSGKSVHFPEGLEDPKGTSIRNGKKVLNRKASLSNLKEPPKPIIPLVQKREHKGLTWKEQQEKRRQDHEKRREALKQQALKWMEAAKKKKELDVQQKKEAAEKAKKKKEEDAEKAKKRAEEDAIKTKKKVEEAKKKKELEVEKAKKAEELKRKKSEEAKKKREIEAKKKEEARKKLAARKSALKKPKAKDSSDGDAEDGVPPPAPDPPSASEEVTKSVLPSDAHEESDQVSPPSDISACHDADPADERIDARAETSLEAAEETQAKLNPGDCTVTQDAESSPNEDQHESLGQACQEPQEPQEPFQDEQGQDEQGGLENQVLDVDHTKDAVAEAVVESVGVDSTGTERQGENALEELAQPHVEVPDEGPKTDAIPAEQPDERGKDSEEPSVDMEALELSLNPSTETPAVDETGHNLQVTCETNNDQEIDRGSTLDQEEAIDEVSPSAEPIETQDEGRLHADCPDCKDILDGPASNDLVDISNDQPASSDHKLLHSDFSPQSAGDTVEGAENIDPSEDHEIPVHVPSAHDSPNHAGDAKETPNEKPSDSTVVPEQILPDGVERAPEHVVDACNQHDHSGAPEDSSNETVPESNHGQDEISSSLPPQEVNDHSLDEDKVQLNSEQTEDDSIPPAPDVPGIDDQSHLDEDGVATLSPQEISEQHSADKLDDSQQSNRQDDAGSLLPAAPEPHGVQSPVEDGYSKEIHKNDISASVKDVEQQSTNDGNHALESEQGYDDSGTSDAPAPTDDTESQSVDRGSLEAKEQQLSDDFEKTEGSNESGHDEAIWAAPNTPLLDEGQQVDEIKAPKTDGVEETSQNHVNGPGEDESSREDLEHDSSDSSKAESGSSDETHEVLETPRDVEEVSPEGLEVEGSKSTESSDESHNASKDGNTDEESQEKATDLQEVKDTSEPHDEHVQDGKDQEPAASDEVGDAETRTSDDGEQSTGSPDAGSDEPTLSPPATSIEGAAKHAEAPNTSQELSDLSEGSENAPNEANSAESPAEVTEVVSTEYDQSQENSIDCQSTVAPVKSAASKSSANPSTQEDESDVANEPESTEVSTVPSLELDAQQDANPQAAPGNVESAPAAAIEDEQAVSEPAAAEKSENPGNTDNSPNSESQDSAEQDYDPGISKVNDNPEDRPASANNDPGQSDPATTPPSEVQSNEAVPNVDDSTSETHSPPEQQQAPPEEPVDASNSSEEQAAESMKEPNSTQEPQDAQPTAKEPSSEPQEEPPESPQYTEADHRIVEEIMNPPPPPPGPKPEPAPKSQMQGEGESVEQQPEASSPDYINGEGASEDTEAQNSATCEDDIESLDDDVDAKLGQEAVSASQECSPEPSPKSASPGEEDKQVDVPQTETQIPATDESTPGNTSPDNKDDELAQDPEDEFQKEDAPAEMINADQQDSSYDPASAEAEVRHQNNIAQDSEPLEIHDAKSGGQSASPQNLDSDTSDEDSDLDDTDDIISVATSMAAAVGDEEDSASEAGGDADGLKIQTVQPSGEDSTPSDEKAEGESALESAADGKDSSEPKAGDAVGSAVQGDSTAEDEEPISQEDSVEPAPPSEQNATESNSADYTDQKLKDADSVEVQEVTPEKTQVSPDESSETVSECTETDKLSQEGSIGTEGDSQPIAQPIAQDPGETPPAGENTTSSSETKNHRNSDPVSEGGAEEKSPKAAPSNEQESSFTTESFPKDSEPLDQGGSEDNAPTEQSDGKNEGTKDQESGKSDAPASGQVANGDNTSDNEAEEVSGEPETEDPTSMPQGENEEAPNSVEAMPETKDDAEPPANSDEQHIEIIANDFHGNEVPQGDGEKDFEQAASTESTDAETSQEGPPAAPVESTGQDVALVERKNEKVAPIVEQQDAKNLEAEDEAHETAVEDDAPLQDSPDVQTMEQHCNNSDDSSKPDGPASDGSAPNEPAPDTSVVDESPVVENPSSESKEQPETSSAVEDKPAPISEAELPIDNPKELEPAQVEDAPLDVHLPQSEKEPEAPSQHHPKALARETPPAKSTPEEVDDLPPSPTNVYEERKHRRRSSVSYHDYPYLRRQSATSTGKGSYTMSSSSRGQVAAAPPPADVRRRNTVDKSFRRVSIPTPGEGRKHEDGQRRRERRRSHAPADADEKRRRRREREAAEVEEARLKAEQAAAELKVKEMAHAERKRRERHEAKKATMREKRRKEEEALRLEQERHVREEELQKQEDEKRRRRAEREALKAKEAEELKRREMEELEKEQARKQRKRERRHRERERRMSMTEGDGYPPVIPPVEDLDKEPPKPRRRRTEEVTKAPPPPPRRQSLVGGLFGLGRSTTEPVVPKAEKERSSETPRRPSNVHRSSSHRKHQRTPSEERRHQERKADRRGSKITTSFDTPVLHDPIPEDPPMVAPEQPELIPSSPVQEEVEPAPIEELEKIPPPLPRSTTAEYGQAERDARPVEPGSSHGESSERRKHRRRHEHHDGDREDRERRHRHRRNSATLDELVGGKSGRRENRGKERDRLAEERDKTKRRSSKVYAEESKRRDSVIEGKHKSGRSGEERERERERERLKNKGANSGGLFGSLKKLVK